MKRTEDIAYALRIIPVVMAVLVLAGCRSTRRTIDTTEVEWSARDSSSVTAAARQESSWVTTLLADSSWWSMLGHIIVYDTSRRDSLGASPVKAEAVISAEHRNAVHQRTDSIRIIHDTIRSEVMVSDSAYAESTYREVVVTKTPWWARLSVILTLTGVAFLLGAVTAIRLKIQ